MQNRLVYAFCALAGCGFSVVAPEDTSDDDPADPSDPTGPIERRCATSDPDLRMCIDFDDATGVPTVFSDGSGRGNDATLVTDVTMTTRDAELAAELVGTSRLHVSEAPDLDIAKELTLSLWARVPDAAMPAIGVERWLLDNNDQYGAYITADGVVACTIAGETVISTPIIAPDTWHHIACTFDGENIVVYVDGYALGCDEIEGGRGGGGPGNDDDDDDSNDEIPITGGDGLAIGAELSPGPHFENGFIGGLDNVQVFARAFSGTEACTGAGQTSCTQTEPDLCNDR
jgi:hypothetical protein